MFAAYRPVDRSTSVQLDTMRGLSALAVLVGHCYQAFLGPIYPSGEIATSLLAQGAVMLFFVLSGFLITKSLARNVNRHGRLDAAKYAEDRFDRIYPPLLLALVIMIAVYEIAPLVLPTGDHSFLYTGKAFIRDGIYLSPLPTLGAMTFTNGFLVDTPPLNGPLWSLSFEVCFYVLAGLIAFSRRGAIVAAALLVMLAALNHAFPLYALVWCAGGAAAVLHNHDRALPKAACGVIAAGLLGAGAMAAMFAMHPAALRYMTAFNICFGIASAAALHLLASGRIALPIDAHRTAGFSYTLYVTHCPLLLLFYGAIQPWVTRSLPRAMIGAFVAFAIAMVAAKALSRIETVRPLGYALRQRKALTQPRVADNFRVGATLD